MKKYKRKLREFCKRGHLMSETRENVGRYGKARCSVCRKEWEFTNREKRRETSRRHWQLNPAKYRERARLWSKNNPERLRAWNLKKRFGISLEDYNALLALQGGVCAICKKGEMQKKIFAVDHDHIDGHVKGLLCARCNVAIGMFRESPEIIESALRYVKRHAQLSLVKKAG